MFIYEESINYTLSKSWVSVYKLQPVWIKPLNSILHIFVTYHLDRFLAMKQTIWDVFLEIYTW